MSDMARMAEGLRRRASRLASAARRLKSAAGAAAPFHLAFATDRRRGPDAMLVARALPAGAALIFRDYDDPNRAARARALKTICAARGVLFLVGGDAALAGEIGAGLHLRSDQLRAPPARPALLTASCHSAEDLARAAALGADAAILGAAFPTASHPGAEALGAPGFKALAAKAGLPVLAIGGVDEMNAWRLAGPNVAGFVAIGAFEKRRGGPLRSAPARHPL
ncbi:MAG: thiamine phosphate synthase [Amphiplicatus sp.]